MSKDSLDYIQFAISMLEIAQTKFKSCHFQIELDYLIDAKGYLDEAIEKAKQENSKNVIYHGN